MEVENGEWTLYGVDADDPYCLHNVEELENYINEIGFLPLFKNEIPGFSVEERTVVDYWWSGDVLRDPWEWRAVIARRGNICYGKFFNGKAGFISKKWLPYFANYRRDGYDFDALCDDEKASYRMEKIMNCFDENTEKFSYELKSEAGFGKGGEKNFEGTVTDLQMRTYLCVRDFRQKKNKKGEEYGWAIAVYCMPEMIFGYELISSAYSEDPKESWNRILEYLKDVYPVAEEKAIRKVLGFGADKKMKKQEIKS